MTDLHLIKLALDTRALLSFARSQGLLRRELDEGYLTHAGLAAVFGEEAPAPFVVESALQPGSAAHRADGAPAVTVLAYSDRSLEQLRACASDLHASLLQWEGSASKPMPFIAAGTEVGFVARLTPTVRSRAPRPGQPTGGRGHGREIDAFLAACFRDPKATVDRAAVYRDWLARQLSASEGPSAATLVDFALRRYERVRLLRKESGTGPGRKGHIIDRPEVVVAGMLKVDDAETFRALLARGVGRHRSFGFGMFLLHAAS